MSNVLPQGWEEVLLKDYLDSIIDYRGKTPKKSESGIVTLSAKSVRMGFIEYDNAYYISEETYKSFMTRGFPKKGDVLITTEAPLGCISRLDRDKVGLAQRLITIRGKVNKLDNGYLLYYLQSSFGQHELTSRATGTTVQGIKRSEFEKVKLILAPINEQKRIADILSAFDDKIELNNQMNQTLEDMATTLFKEWFENFNFPNEQDKPYKDNDGKMKSSELGEIPIDWEVKTLDELLEITSSKRVFRSDYVESGVPFYRSKEVILKSNGQDISDCLYISNEKFEEIKSKYEIPKKGEILLTSVGTLGIPYLIQDEEFYFKDGNLTWFKNFKYKSVNFYIYLWIKYCGGKKSLDEIVIGSTQKALTINALKNIKIIFSEEIIKDFVKRVSIIMEQIQQNQQQNQTLKQQRDTLLPKLMSGEIRV